MISSLPSVERLAAFCSLIITAIAFPAELRAQSTLIPLVTRQAMVFDHASKYLYISTTNGLVQRYNLAINQIDKSYNLGGGLNGLDIAPDDSFLLVAQNNTSDTQGFFQKVDVATGAITNIPFDLSNPGGEGGAWDIAIASNGFAFASTVSLGSGFITLHQIDLATNSVSRRMDAGGFGAGRLSAPVQINRAGDGSLLYFMEGDISDGPVFIYNALTNEFGPTFETGNSLTSHAASAAVNRNGTLIATRTTTDFAGAHASLDTGPDFTFRHDFNGIDGGVAFGGQTEILYGVNWTKNQIIAYDTNTFAEKFRLNIGETTGSIPFLGTADFVASPDGHYLALSTPSGIRIFSTSAGFVAPPPTPALSTRRDVVFDHSGNFAYITTSDGFVERYDLASGTLQIIGDLGGILDSVDIAPDDSFLIVAQANAGVAQGAFQRLDLISGAITNINYLRDFSEFGALSVAIAANGLAFGTTGGSPVYQIDLATNTSSIRRDVPETGGGIVHRSGDYSLLLFGGDGLNIYDATTDKFVGPRVSPPFFSGNNLAVSRNGSLIASQNGTHSVINTGPDLKFVHPFDGTDGGIAFDGTTDNLYAVNSVSNQIIAYDTNNFEEQFRINIGDLRIGGGNSLFGGGNLRASPDGRHLALTTDSGVQFYTVPATAPSPTPAPTLQDPRDMVFDRSGTHLYIGDGKGWVHRYNIFTNQFEDHYNVGGQPNGIDIAPDDSFLIVAQGVGGLTQGSFQKIDLATRAITNATYDFALYSPDDLPLGVAIAPNGLAIALTANHVRQIDPFTNLVTLRADSHMEPSSSTTLWRGADRSLFCIVEGTSFNFAVTYTAATNSFSPEFITNRSNLSVAVNRDGSRIAQRDGTGADLETASGFSVVHFFDALDGGLAFDASKDYLYGVSTTTSQIVAFDTNDFTEKFRLSIGEPIPSIPEYLGGLGAGRFVASPDGRSLALITRTAVRIFDLTAPTLPTAATPLISPGSQSFKKSITAKLSCSTPGATIFYSITSKGKTATVVYPTATGKKKDKGIKMFYTTTLQAWATAPGYSQSAIASETYTRPPKVHP